MRARTISLLLPIRSLQGAQPCCSHVSPPTPLPRPARPSGSCAARLDHRCLDGFRRSVLVRHHRRELSRSKKNMSQNEKVLTSEPLSKHSTGRSIQSLYRKIDSHSCAVFLALTRIIHRPTIQGERRMFALYALLLQ